MQKGGEESRLTARAPDRKESTAAPEQAAAGHARSCVEQAAALPARTFADYSGAGTAYNSPDRATRRRNARTGPYLTGTSAQLLSRREAGTQHCGHDDGHAATGRIRKLVSKITA